MFLIFPPKQGCCALKNVLIKLPLTTRKQHFFGNFSSHFKNKIGEQNQNTVNIFSSEFVCLLFTFFNNQHVVITCFNPIGMVNKISFLIEKKIVRINRISNVVIRISCKLGVNVIPVLHMTKTIGRFFLVLDSRHKIPLEYRFKLNYNTYNTLLFL